MEILTYLENTGVKTCKVLLEQFKSRDARIRDPKKLEFAGVGGRDVYNITAPFEAGGVTVIAGRVESRDSEQSELMFFVEREGRYTPLEGAPVLRLQDPFHTRIGGELVIGGVEVFPHPEDAEKLGWRTVIYKGPRLEELQPLFHGPDGMKDLRLVELADGSIGVFTRPQGAKGGRGKIGFFRLSSLDELTVESVEAAPLLPGQFTDEEWGGANEIHRLSGGLLGVLGHIACYDERGDRHYYPMAFAFDPHSGTASDIELIAIREQFLPGPAKRADLQNVVFSGGLVRLQDGRAVLYAGIGDAEAQSVQINDPFARFEFLPARKVE